MQQDPWEADIPARYAPGDVVTGKVTKLTNFGVFVELEPGLEGLLHISELADHKVGSPEEVVAGRRHRGDGPPHRPRRAQDRPVAQEGPRAPGSRGGGPRPTLRRPHVASTPG